MKLFGLVGASGFGRGVMPIANKNLFSNYNQIEAVFVELVIKEQFVGNNRVMNERDFLNEIELKFFNVAIADWRIRRKVVSKYTMKLCKPINIVAENALIYDRVSIGEGAIICSFSHITSDVSIGKYFHCNIYSYIEHDCIIGDYVTFAPRVCCNGNVVIEDNAYIGAGAIIKQGKPGNPIIIGEGAIVGMGAVVTKNVPAQSVVFGNPAREIIKS